MMYQNIKGCVYYYYFLNLEVKVLTNLLFFLALYSHPPYSKLLSDNRIPKGLPALILITPWVPSKQYPFTTVFVLLKYFQQ